MPSVHLDTGTYLVAYNRPLCSQVGCHSLRTTVRGLPIAHYPHSTSLLVVSASFDFAREEEKVIKFWREIDAFQTSLKLSEGRPEYSFYDGPPFATGLPHYGHLLAGTIKVGTSIPQKTTKSR